jgi:ActD protein
MSAVYALYSDGESAQRAVSALRSAGVGDADITVISDEPMERYEFGEMHKQTRIWYIASAGGVVGLAIATWLTRMTELAWPLPTGNMPIVAWWPNLIIMFELTMLGAIIATVLTLVIAGGLGRPMPPLYDPAVTEGMILVGVDGSRDPAAVERALAAGSPAETKRL